MWVLDIQSALQKIQTLNIPESGSLREVLKNKPDLIHHLGRKIHILDVNQTALEVEALPPGTRIAVRFQPDSEPG